MATGAGRPTRWPSRREQVHQLARAACCNGPAGEAVMTGTSRTPRERTYGVKLVRGPFVAVPRHPKSCPTEKELVALRRSTTGPVAADLFCGAGGMSLGLQDAGYKVLVGVDHDAAALETYGGYFPGLALERDLSNPVVVADVGRLLKRLKIDLIAGGPPCQPFSRAGRSKIRSLVEQGLRHRHDTRRDLWQAFLDIVAAARPKCVLLENVPEMALGDDLVVLRAIVDELEELGYSVYSRLVDAWRYGVPQFRQRLIVVAVQRGGGFHWPEELGDIVTVDNAIGDLPPVQGGWRPDAGAEGYLAYQGPSSTFQRRARRALRGASAGRVYDQITRPVRADDAIAFAQMDSETSYSDIDPELRRYRTDIFDDKYKRLDAHELSRSITAHIARDGYWYIHPRQDRTLTIREAARIQTFPDRFRFAGPPSAAFRQIGNAVPPLLAERLGAQLRIAVSSDARATWSTRDVSASLRGWLVDRPHFNAPWIHATSAWQVIAGELMLHRTSQTVIRSVWPMLEKLDEPSVAIERCDDVAMIGRWMKKPERGKRLLTTARYFMENPTALDTVDGIAAAPEVSGSVAALAGIVTQLDGASPVPTTQGALRCAARFTGLPVDRVNKQSHGRMAIGRLIGAGEDRNAATVALLEVASELCTPQAPHCDTCPLRMWCAHATGSGSRHATSREFERRRASDA